MEPNKKYELKDGDMIRIGSYLFNINNKNNNYFLTFSSSTCEKNFGYKPN